jgi:hypothetical protein
MKPLGLPRSPQTTNSRYTHYGLNTVFYSKSVCARRIKIIVAKILSYVF